MPALLYSTGSNCTRTYEGQEHRRRCGYDDGCERRGERAPFTHHLSVRLVGVSARK